jgi:hypothetical protein
VATPVYDDYDPYATYPEPEPARAEPSYVEPGPAAEYRDETTGLTLRDRFAARRTKVAAAAEADRYADDDTPTLVNLDTRRELRRQEEEERRTRRTQSSSGRGRRHRDDDDDDLEYWARLRGEAR